jgi:arabinose-5-phosphate isomerase
MTAVVDAEGRAVGVFTDGDLRRALARGIDVRTADVAAVMTRSPRSIGPDRLAAEAVEEMERWRINGMLVVDDAGRLVGALNTHDLLQAKVI